MSINCWLTNRDLLYFPRNLARQLSAMDGVGRIAIIDCGSTYEPLLSWYETCPYEVFFVKNLGHHATWRYRESPDLGQGECYFATDADIDLSDCPRDMLLHFREALNEHRDAVKVGCSLRIDDLPDTPRSEQIRDHESKFWTPGPEGWYEADIDTVGAMYRPESGWAGYGPSLRSAKYIARHMPWYVAEPAADMRHYLANMKVDSLTWGPRLKEEFEVTQ